jgi:hypothetical protein
MDLMRWLRAEWDRVLGSTLIILGALVLVVGYRGVSNTTDVPEELAFLVSGGLGGLFLLGVGATLLLTASLHDEWRKLDRLEARLQTVEAMLDARGEDRPPVGSAGGEHYVVAAGGPGDHLPPVRAASALPAGHGASGDVLRRSGAVASGGFVTAVVLLAAGWTRASGAGDTGAARSGVIVGVAGLAAAGCGTLFATGTLAQTIRRRRTGLAGAWSRPASPRPPAATVGQDDGRRFTADGLTRAHRSGCPVLARLEVRPVSGPAVDLPACGLCEPG